MSLERDTFGGELIGMWCRGKPPSPKAVFSQPPGVRPAQIVAVRYARGGWRLLCLTRAFRFVERRASDVVLCDDPRPVPPVHDPRVGGQS